jgi:hypothetical protein
LIERQAMIHPVGTVFYVWQRGDRLIVAFDPSAIKLDRVNDSFSHDLSTRLKGRKVVRTNSRGLFLQVGFETPPAPMPLAAIPLDLAKQPSSWHMPIGQTQTGPLWISLIEGDSFLISGSRRKGKSGLTHAMIQALLHGGRTQVYAWDGKGGAEYQGYIGHPNFHFINNAESGLKSLADLLAERMKQLRASGHPNIIMHNEAGQDFIEPIALFVDEIAELDNPLKETLKRMVKLYGATGLYPLLATNDPTQAAILVKMNLSTRISFAVPSFQDSLTVLGMKGAETLSDRGRGMIVWDGKLTEFQSFQVTYPTPTDEQRRLLAEMATTEETEPPVLDEIAQMAEQIRPVWHQGMSKRAVAKFFDMNYAGSATAKIDRVIARLSATTTTQDPDSGPDEAE